MDQRGSAAEPHEARTLPVARWAAIAARLQATVSTIPLQRDELAA
ncbi:MULTISPECIES: hypothetical protein [Cellulomonas]|jgi:hypothetical protein|uniref:Uncharacterized protein n=1 Tax=Cellulomonas iranensis TaxID=76862 RepID=A0ABU0GK57_9CELL|nr:MULTISPECIES: hypothetical protein [Cellulomonas]MDQ0425468.1 hypothetical protein [Cellulomonas iranensis]